MRTRLSTHGSSSGSGWPSLESIEEVDGITTAIYTWEWDSTGGHNGTHQFGSWGTFDGVPGDPVYYPIIVKNLAIESVDPPHYAIWNGTDPVTITVNLEDNNLNDPMDIEVTIWPTDDLWSVRTIRVEDVTGPTHQIEWDGKDWSQAFVEPGPYTYEVEVYQEADWDYVSYRNWEFYALSHEGRWRRDASGDIIEVEHEGYPFYVQEFAYELNQPPSEVIVDMLGTGWDLADRALTSDRIRTWENPILLYHPALDGSESGGTEGRTVLCAVDQCGLTYRDHRNRPMLAENWLYDILARRFVLQFTLNGLNQSNLNELWSIWLWDWFPIEQWTSTSGRNMLTDYHEGDQHMNRRDPCEWEGGDRIPRVGPIPHVDDIEHDPYMVKLKITNPPVPGMFLYCEGHEPYGYNYCIHNWADLDKTYKDDRTHWRSELRVHPDGYPYGTSGCIGVGGDAPDCTILPICQAAEEELIRLSGKAESGHLLPYGLPSNPTEREEAIKKFKANPYVPLYVTSTLPGDYARYVYEIQSNQ